MGQAPDEDVTPASSPASEPLDKDTRVEVETLKVEIEQTRSGISETLQALEERLTPGNLATDAAAAVKDKAARTMEQAMTTASRRMGDMADKTRDAAQSVAETMRDNPWPAVLVGAGLGYALYRTFGERRQHWEASWNNRAYAYGELYDEPYPEERRETLGRRASTTAQRTGRMFRDNPLGFGIAAMAIGAAIGLSAPETETENEWMGETRDRVVDRARQAVGVNETPGVSERS